MVKFHGLTTINRSNLYDYLRCPKILGIKFYKKLHPHLIKKRKTVTKPKIRPQLAGKIGEIATTLIFSPSELFETYTPDYNSQKNQILRELNGINLNDFESELLYKISRRINDLRSEIKQKLGTIEIISHGNTRNGAMQSFARPDFVAIIKDSKTPILVETKSGKGAVRKDYYKTDHVFQAKYYNSIAKNAGGILQSVRQIDDKITFDAQFDMDTPAQTLLLYPQVGDFKLFDQQIPLNDSLFRDIWKVKQLALNTRLPVTDCDKTCPHFKMDDFNLKEGDIEVIEPLPVSIAKYLDENGEDFTRRYYQVQRKNNPLISMIYTKDRDIRLYKLQLSHLRKQIGKKGVKQVTKKIAALEEEWQVIEDRYDLGEMINILRKPGKERGYNLERELGTEIENWMKLNSGLEPQIDNILTSSKRIATMIFSLPKGPKRFINRVKRIW